MGLSSEEHRDEDTWGCFLLDLAQNGYNPEANVMDAGAGMTAAFHSILPEISIRYDHFHILKDVKDDLRFLKNKKESAMTEVIKLSTKIDKARKKNKHQKYSVKLNSAKKSLEHLESIYQTFKTLTEWLQYDVLQLQSINYQDRVKSYRSRITGGLAVFSSLKGCQLLYSIPRTKIHQTHSSLVRQSVLDS